MNLKKQKNRKSTRILGYITTILTLFLFFSSSQALANCQTTSNFIAKVTADRNGNTGRPNCLKKGKTYYVGANCIGSGYQLAYHLDIFGNGGTVYTSFDCGWHRSFTVQNDTSAVFINLFPSCTGQIDDYDASKGQSFQFNVCR